METRGAASTEQMLEFAAAVTRQLPRGIKSETAKWWIEHQAELQERLSGLAVLPLQPWQKPWRTVKLGIGPKSGKEFEEMEKAGYRRVSDRARQLFLSPAFTVAQQEKEVRLVRVSVAGLGFSYSAKISQIYERARKLGLGLCPAEIGPQLRLQYEQPAGEWLLVAMEPITDSDGAPNVFRVERISDGFWLHASYADPDSFWSPDSYWLFVAPASVEGA